MKNFLLLKILIISSVLVILFGFILPSTNRNSFLPDSYISSLFTNIHNGDLFKPKEQEPSKQDSVQTVNPSTGTENYSAETAPAVPAKKLEFTQVDKSYFDDALFIGDSRMVGMQEYSGLTNATFYASVGMTVYDLFKDAFIKIDGHSKPVTLEKALSQKKFGKIYIMVGINEMGTGTLQNFTNAYKAAVERIEKLQPNAVIFIQGILYVTASRSDSDHIFNNNNIRSRNNSLAKLADNKRRFYIDVNEVTSDSNGNLNKDYSWDNCHLKAQHYSLWIDFLMKHGIVLETAQ